MRHLIPRGVPIPQAVVGAIGPVHEPQSVRGTSVALDDLARQQTSKTVTSSLNQRQSSFADSLPAPSLQVGRFSTSRRTVWHE